MFAATTPQLVYVIGFAMSVLFTSVGVTLMASEHMRKQFEHLATHDNLTGALMRRALIENCNEELARCRRNGQTLALLMLDLDHFKAINDTHGHLVGDEVLIDFVKRVSAQLRLPDRLGRYGGEEFMVLLPETSPAEALVVAQRILTMPVNDRGLPHCTVSIGLATNAKTDTASASASGTDGGATGNDSTADSLLQRADAALYNAKRNGRNRIEQA